MNVIYWMGGCQIGSPTVYTYIAFCFAWYLQFTIYIPAGNTLEMVSQFCEAGRKYSRWEDNLKTLILYVYLKIKMKYSMLDLIAANRAKGKATRTHRVWGLLVDCRKLVEAHNMTLEPGKGAEPNIKSERK